jgi:hypothetical protein
MSLTKVSYSMINGAPINILDLGAVMNDASAKTANTAALNAAKTAPEFGALVDRAGEVVRHSGTAPKAYEGVRRLQFADEFGKDLASRGPISPAIQESLDAAKSKYTGMIKNQLDTGAQDAFQQQLHNMQMAARGPVSPDQIAAQGHINQIAKGNYSSVANKLNVPYSELTGKLNPDVLNDASQWASKARAANHNYTNVPSYAAYMNESARNLKPPKPPGDPSFLGVKWRPGKMVSRAIGGATLGSLVGMPWLGAGVGATTGLIGTAPTLIGGAAAGTYLGHQALKGVSNAVGLGGQDTQARDMTGELQDRHRVVPFMNNIATGAIGGALIAALIANHSGYSGPMSWLLPILGGVAGYHYLPQMMNKWKDPYGVGENAISPLAANMNQMHPLGQ